ncbi:MAG: FtsX-like permease family protein [Phycisphaerales bacterium]|nr:MAG: FtsX-like permease family protein [Phycisphaerales bacterium]
MFFLRMLLAAARSLRANFVRSILAILGIVIGVGTVISAMGVVEGATRDLVRDMSKVGSNVLWVRPGSTRRGGVTIASVKPLSPEDVDDMLDEPSVAAAAPEILRFDQIKYGAKNEYGQVVGTREEFFDVFSYEAASGRTLNRADTIARRRVAVLGSDMAKDLFDKRSPLGEQIRIARDAFTVVGVLKEKGVVGFANFDKQVYVPITRVMAMYNVRTLSQISVRGEDRYEMEETRSAAAAVLRRKHRLQLGESDDFTVTSQKEMFEQFSKMIRIMQSLFFAVSGISLIVGGFGIMNIMLVSVTERTREIGVRMAVGAYRGDIMAQFLGESSMICVVGAPLGIALGWFINRLVEIRLAPLKPILASDIVLIAVGVAIATGIVSGLYPAWRASRLNPVDALRYE